jgi:hypothetical protein
LLPDHPRIEAFLDAAERHGLPREQAVRLAVERELVLSDAEACSLPPDSARYLLNRLAEVARPDRALPPARADYVRRLRIAARRDSRSARVERDIELPDTLAVRVADGVRLGAFDADAVHEMIAWEAAAAMAGRTMTEWALKAFAVRRAAS